MSTTACTCAALRQASRYLTRLYDEALAPAGLGINQYSILSRLGQGGPMAPQDLARSLVMDRSTLGHLLRPLEARGLVTVAPGVTDARRRLLSLAEPGVAVLAVARPLWSEAQKRFDGAFGAVEAAALRGTLAHLVALPIGKAGGVPPADPAATIERALP